MRYFLMIKIVPSNQFRKDLKLAAKRGFKIENLKNVVDMLASEQTLPGKYRDHSLTGKLSWFS